MSIAGLKYYLSSPANMFDFFASRNMLNWMSDEAFLKRKFKLRMGYELDLDNPKTFNEKLQWLKLYDRNPLYTKLVDKYEVRKYIAEKIGEGVSYPACRRPVEQPGRDRF
ncbi:MAG: ATP-grasp fold amidoligase family protein [Oscillospiraceae bacterium]